MVSVVLVAACCRKRMIWHIVFRTTATEVNRPKRHTHGLAVLVSVVAAAAALKVRRESSRSNLLLLSALR